MDKDIIKAITSTGNGEYSTPQYFFDFLNKIFEFDIDLAASKNNTKCKKFYSLEKDAFRKKWSGSCFMNPPYSKPQRACEPGCVKQICTNRGYHLDRDIPGLIDWISRAKSQYLKYDSTIVCLVPARTETKWFQIAWKYARALCFVKGRLAFVDTRFKDKVAKNVSLFPNVLIVFSNEFYRSTAEKLSKIGPVVGNFKGSRIIGG